MENKRLSPIRVLLAILILAGVSYFVYLQTKNFVQRKAIAKSDPWFGPYVDVTATPLYSFEQTDSNAGIKNMVLSFIVSDKTDPCMPSWGGAYTLDDASTKLDLDRRIARLRQKGGQIAISFGGQLNDELAINCTDQGKLQKAYQSVIDRYNVDTIDLDIEGSGLTNIEAVKRRAIALSSLQKEAKSNGKNLAIWLTLPVAPQGLTEDGTNAISEMLKANVDLAGVNVMTMDYGNSKSANISMEKSSESALNETHRQLGIIYDQAGIHLNDASIWSKIGATVMIGQNDVSDEIFTLDDAKGLNEFANSKGVARLSMWSLNRDVECGENYVNINIVSDSCSGIKQDKLAFTNTLKAGFEANLSNSASKETKEDKEEELKPDNPEESPYQIWSEEGSYLEGTKVVWHHSVYVSKWWTKGDLPDNPVLQSWQTPWQLIGPVLQGEKPIPQATVAPGTYPEWSGTSIYEAGDKVLLNGVPYQAKWWTQGDSPAASRSNPDSSPWLTVTPK